MSLRSPIFTLPLGLQFKAAPGVPFVLEQVPETMSLLKRRSVEVSKAYGQLDTPYTIQGHSASGLAFLGFTEPPQPELMRLSLDDARQFAISWTKLYDIRQRATQEPNSVLDQYASTLTAASATSAEAADAATNAFWPLLAREAAAFNLLVVKKLRNVADVPDQLQAALPAETAALAGQGLLYAIDLLLLSSLPTQPVADGTQRFTPGTYTLLSQDPLTKALTPVAILVAGPTAAPSAAGEAPDAASLPPVQVYRRGVATPGAWLYALQAAKTSLTVYGIWIGHVYHWHLVTAAMQMTMYNTFQQVPTHPVYELLAPQSQYLIGFNNALLLFWPALAPPTSLGSPLELLALADQYATGRSFFDDDPRVTLTALGLQASDFTQHAPWDQYPVVQQLLAVWDASQQYVERVVAVSYPTDAAVAADPLLQAWMTYAGPYPSGDQLHMLYGNLPGLPPMSSVASLTRVLTSIIYRTTVHGISRLVPQANPALTFVANFPPCLQRDTLPAPNAALTDQELLTYLPNTGTIGAMVRFYYTFSFSPPYESFIPAGGTAANLYFPEPATGPRNQALVRFRTTIQRFIRLYYPFKPDQAHQWPLNIET